MAVSDLYCDAFGAANKPVLVILHGFLASSRNWRRIAEQLSTRFRVLVPDLRNHGASPHDPVMDYPALANDLGIFLDARALDSVMLLGHSMGGKVAMWFALQHSERVRRLIVVDIAPVAYRHSFQGILQVLQTLPLAQINNRKQAEALLADAIPEQAFRQFLLQNLVLQDGRYHWRVDLEILCRTAPNIVGFPDVSKLPPFTGASLFIAGAESDYVDEAAVKPLFPQSRLVSIAGAGHWLHVEQPAAFIRQVEMFCDDAG